MCTTPTPKTPLSQFLQIVIMTFQINNVAKSKSLANMVKIVVFKMVHIKMTKSKKRGFLEN